MKFRFDDITALNMIFRLIWIGTWNNWRSQIACCCCCACRWMAKIRCFGSSHRIDRWTKKSDDKFQTRRTSFNRLINIERNSFKYPIACFFFSSCFISWHQFLSIAILFFLSVLWNFNWWKAKSNRKKKSSSCQIGFSFFLWFCREKNRIRWARNSSFDRCHSTNERISIGERKNFIIGEVDFNVNAREREREKELLWSMIDRISSRRLLFENNSLCLFEISDKSSSWRCKNVPIFVYHPRSIAFYTFEISRTKLLPKKCTISSVNTVRFVKFVLVILLIREVGQGLLFIVRSFTFSNRYGIRGLWRHLRCEKCLRSFVGFQRLQSLFSCLVLSSEQSIRKNQFRQRKREISQSSSQIRIEYIIEISSFFLCCVYSCTEMSNSCSVHWINVKEKGDQSSDDDDFNRMTRRNLLIYVNGYRIRQKKYFCSKRCLSSWSVKIDIEQHDERFSSLISRNLLHSTSCIF